MVLPITFPTRARLFPPHCFHCFLSADKRHWHCWQPWTNHCHWPKRATSWSISSNLIFMWVGQWFFTRRSSEIECRGQLVYFSLTKFKMFMKLHKAGLRHFLHWLCFLGSDSEKGGCQPDGLLEINLTGSRGQDHTIKKSELNLEPTCSFNYLHVIWWK